MRDDATTWRYMGGLLYTIWRDFYSFTGQLKHNIIWRDDTTSIILYTVSILNNEINWKDAIVLGKLKKCSAKEIHGILSLNIHYQIHSIDKQDVRYIYIYIYVHI